MTMTMILMVMIIPMLPEEIEKVLPVNPLHEYQEQINLHCQLTRQKDQAPGH